MEISLAAPPTLGLPQESYSTVKTYRLKNPKLVWLSSQWQKYAATYSLPQSRQYVEAWILQNRALISDTDQPDLIDKSQSIVLYADKYGDQGLNGNLGSGRAASFDDDQIKGFPTPLIGPNADELHRNGVVRMSAGIKEAYWSEILNQELPYGANQTVAIIDTGMMIATRLGTVEPRVLVLRKDPLRPAQFLPNFEMQKLDPIADNKRVKKAMSKLQPLWAKRMQMSSNTSLKELTLEYTKRLAIQFGYAYAHRIHHGAITASNIDMSGAFLDFSTLTTVDGYQPLMGSDLKPHGDPQLPYEFILKPLINGIRSEFGEDTLPDDKSLRSFLFQTFEETVNLEMLRIAGFQVDVARKMLSKKAGQDFLTLVRVMMSSNREQKIESKQETPAFKDGYNVNAILMGLAHNYIPEGLIADPNAQMRLEECFQTLILESSQPISDLQSQADILNRRRITLMRTAANLQKELLIVNSYVKDRSTEQSQASIDQIVTSNLMPTTFSPAVQIENFSLLNDIKKSVCELFLIPQINTANAPVP